MAAGCRRGCGCPIDAGADDRVPGDSRVPPVPQGRRDRRRGREPAPLLRRARLRERARRHPWHRRLRRRLPRRVPPAGAGRRARGPGVARGAGVVHGCRRDDRLLVGRLQRAPGRRAPTAAAQGGRHALLDRRPLRRRLPLRGRVPARRRHAQVGVVDARVQRAARRPRSGRERLARELGSKRLDADTSLPRRLGRPSDAATSSGGRDRSPRTTRRSRCRCSWSADGPTRTPTPSRACWRSLDCPRRGDHRAVGAHLPRARRAGTRRSASCRSACAGSTHWLLGDGHRRHWTSRCFAPGSRSRSRRPTSTPSGPAVGSPRPHGRRRACEPTRSRSTAPGRPESVGGLTADPAPADAEPVGARRDDISAAEARLVMLGRTRAAG